jgi:nickel/cobalt exporter
MIDWLIAFQKWLYSGMSEGMKSTVDLSGLLGLTGAAFLFGVVHALMPGHGKSVLVSYHLGRPSKLLEGVTSGTLLALSHVGIAVILVLSGVAVISRSLAAGGRAPAFETMSATLITLIGVYLLVRALWPSNHAHMGTAKQALMAAPSESADQFESEVSPSRQ